MYNLYVKWPNQKKYLPIDWKKGLQVGNLIFASIFTAEDRSTVEAELNKQKFNNPGMEWKFKKLKGA